jgi:hypothetical protein
MSFWIRTADVGGYVQPWMRVDGQEADKLLAFDNMCRRFIMGTTDWTQHHIVLDVPGESTNIAFGVILGGKGNVWLDDVSFEIVSRDVAVTDCPCSQGNFSTKEPTNLDFEQGEEEEVCS